MVASFFIRQFVRRSPEWQVAFLGKTEPRAARPEDVPGEGYE
jgi:hypothetical protein